MKSPPKWLRVLINLILRPGVGAFRATYLMLYANGQLYHFLAGAIAFKACIEFSDVCREARDAG